MGIKFIRLHQYGFEYNNFIVSKRIKNGSWLYLIVILAAVVIEALAKLSEQN